MFFAFLFAFSVHQCFRNVEWFSLDNIYKLYWRSCLSCCCKKLLCGDGLRVSDGNGIYGFLEPDCEGSGWARQLKSELVLKLYLGPLPAVCLARHVFFFSRGSVLVFLSLSLSLSLSTAFMSVCHFLPVFSCHSISPFWLHALNGGVVGGVCVQYWFDRKY